MLVFFCLNKLECYHHKQQKQIVMETKITHPQIQIADYEKMKEYAKTLKVVTTSTKVGLF